MAPGLHKAAKELQQHKFSGVEEGNEYSGTEFGGFGEYFHNKLIKLQNQAQEATEAESEIFKDCIIYITGYTRPSAPEIRTLVNTHGGTICHYLAGKSFATHIVASSLTARKRIEYAKYKIVRPEWITDSVKTGRQLPWHDYRVTSDHVNVAKRPLQDYRNLPDALDSKFIENYYKNSRLHHLSSWKGELKRRFQNMAKKSNHKNSQQSNSTQYRKVIMHVDFDSFFVAVSLLKHPELVNVPICVSSGNAQGSGSADIASCNYEARKYGVKNGMWMSHAKELCPDLKSVSYDFEGYERASTALYNVLISLEPDILFPVSVDEALVDITGVIRSDPDFVTDDEHHKRVVRFCSELRQRIKKEALVNVSVGAGNNVLLAKVALRKAKPDGEYAVLEKDSEEFLSTFSVRDLPGIGPHITEKLKESDITTVEDVRLAGRAKIIKIVGEKLGIKLYEASKGRDDTDISEIPGPKSIGVEIAWGIRLKTDEHVRMFTTNLCKELIRRMTQESPDLKGSQLVAKVYQRHPSAPMEPPKYLGHGHCDITSKSSLRFEPTNDEEFLVNTCCDLVASFSCPPEDFRGLGLQLTKLDTDPTQQLPKNQSKLQFEPASPSSPSTAGPSLKRIRSTSNSPIPVQAGNVPKFLTITQQFRRQHNEPPELRRRKKLKISEGVIDLPTEISPDVLDQLPPDMQKEILKLQTKMQTPEPPPKEECRIAMYRPVKFLGTITNEAEIRQAISAWINSTKYPHYDDVVEVEDYLLNVIAHDRNWGKAPQLLDHMRRCICRLQRPGPEWYPLYETWCHLVQSKLKTLRNIAV